MSIRCAPRSRICGRTRRAGGLRMVRVRAKIPASGKPAARVVRVRFCDISLPRQRCAAQGAAKSARQLSQSSAELSREIRAQNTRDPLSRRNCETPVHLFSVTGQYASAPVLICTGGVDTYKMGLHPIYVTLAKRLGITILGFDIAGTGESTIPLSIKGDELVLGIVNEARKLGNGKVAHLGFSFGGNFWR